MSTQVTLTLSDELYEYAQRWATLMGRDLSEALADALTIVLTPMHTTPQLAKPVASEKPTTNLSFAAAVAEFGMLLRNSEFKGSANYAHVLTQAQASQGPDTFGYRAELIELVKKAQSLDTRATTGRGIQFKHP